MFLYCDETYHFKPLLSALYKQERKWNIITLFYEADFT